MASHVGINELSLVVLEGGDENTNRIIFRWYLKGSNLCWRGFLFTKRNKNYLCILLILGICVLFWFVFLKVSPAIFQGFPAAKAGCIPQSRRLFLVHWCWLLWLSLWPLNMAKSPMKGRGCWVYLSLMGKMAKVHMGFLLVPFICEGFFLDLCQLLWPCCRFVVLDIDSWMCLAGKVFKTSMDFWNVNAGGLSRLKRYQHFNFHSKVAATPKTLPNTTVVEERKILWKRTLIYFWWTGFYIDVWELYCLHLSHLQEAFCNRISTLHQTKLLTVNIPPPQTELLRGLEWWRLKIVTMILQLFSPFLLLSYHFTFTTEIMYTLYVVLGSI